MDPLQQDIADAPHQDILTISNYSRREEEGAEVMIDLPEEIVVKIIAMAPFPSIFKAVGLSKAWRARFLPSNKSPEVMRLSKFSTSDSCRLEDEENERGLATSFQKQVIGEWSKNWETFSPVFIAKDHLVTYCQKSRNWRRLSLSSLPEITFRSQMDSRYINDIENLQMEGALVIYQVYMDCYSLHKKEIYVADILTQRCQQLPTPPKSGRAVCSKVVTNTSSGTYNMIILSRDENFRHDGHDHFCTHVYESHSETWSTLCYAVTVNFFSGFIWSSRFETGGASAAYLNGVLYMVTKDNLKHILAFNLAKRTLEELELSCQGEDTWVTNWRISLLVCNDNQLVIVKTTDYPSGHMQVLEVNLQSLHLIRLSQGPPASLRKLQVDGRAVSDKSCIFFKAQNGPGKDEVLQYNVKEDAWSSFPIPAQVVPSDRKTYHFIGNSFEPSLSAFVSL